jgi:Protein of unknown function (DUF2975)
MKALGKGSLSSVLLVLLNIGWYMVALALAVTLCAIAVGSTVGVQIDADGAPSVDVGRGVRMTIPVAFNMDGERVTAASLGIADARIHDARASLRFTPVRGPFFIANAVLLVVLLSLALWVVGLLRALFRTLRDGQPFVPVNALRIRRIGYAAIICELVRSAVVFSENYYAMTHFTADGLRFIARPDLNVLAIVNGLIILAIAEVFRLGARLDEDQSLTV